MTRGNVTQKHNYDCYITCQHTLHVNIIIFNVMQHYASSNNNLISFDPLNLQLYYLSFDSLKMKPVNRFIHLVHRVSFIHPFTHSFGAAYPLSSLVQQLIQTICCMPVFRLSDEYLDWIPGDKVCQLILLHEDKMSSVCKTLSVSLFRVVIVLWSISVTVSHSKQLCLFLKVYLWDCLFCLVLPEPLLFSNWSQWDYCS